MLLAKLLAGAASASAEPAVGGLTNLHPARIARCGQGIELAARTKGPFATYMRLYWPKEAALDGSWTQPKLLKAK